MNITEYKLTNTWISINDAVPKAHADVLITNGERVYIGHIGNDLKSWFTDLDPAHFKQFGLCEVTHWMILPEVPK